MTSSDPQNGGRAETPRLGPLQGQRSRKVGCPRPPGGQAAERARTPGPWFRGSPAAARTGPLGRGSSLVGPRMMSFITCKWQVRRGLSPVTRTRGHSVTSLMTVSTHLSPGSPGGHYRAGENAARRRGQEGRARWRSGLSSERQQLLALRASPRPLSLGHLPSGLASSLPTCLAEGPCHLHTQRRPHGQGDD